MVILLDKLKLRLGIELSDASQDNLLNQMLEDAQNEILDYCNREVLLPKMESLQRKLAIIYYNRQGTEGEASHSEGGMSVSYSTEIPENIKAGLNRYTLAKAVRIANAPK